jgi:hypothetical protein
MAKGSEPEDIKLLLQRLEPLSCGLSLCGAGAGGYVVCILKRARDEESLKEAVYNLFDSHLDAKRLTVDKVVVDNKGLEVEVLREDLSMEAIFAKHMLVT